MLEKLFAALGFINIKTYQDLLELNQDTLHESKKYCKPAPKLKSDTQRVLETLLTEGFKHIGTIQDEYVFIYMLANFDEMYYLHANYDGELMYLLKEINNKNIDSLISDIQDRHAKTSIYADMLNAAFTELETERKRLTVAREMESTVEYNTLNDSEKQTVSAIESVKKQLTPVITWLRG